MKQPNVLWICTDQQRFDTLGCYGNAFVHTPNIDALAESGVLFEQCFSQSPVCTPSRGSFLTGRYPSTTRLRQNGQDIPASEVLVTKIFADAGYVCGLSGKLHLSTCDFRVIRGTERRIDDGYSEFHWMHAPGTIYATSAYNQWLRDKGVEYKLTDREDCRYVQSGMKPEHHHTTFCAEKAIRFIEAHEPKDYPWLFSVNIFDPHHGFDPPAEHLARYLDRLDEIPLPNYTEGELDNKPIFQKLNHRGAYNNKRGNLDYEDMTETEHRMVTAAYWAMCDLIDEQVGRMLQALERTGQRDDTIVIFMSDHGEMLGDHGIYLKGPFFYEGAIRVPLICSWPGRIEPGRRSRALVELTELAPTLLAAAGLPLHPGMQGRSLWPLLTGQAEDIDHFRDEVYCEYHNAMPSHKDPQAHATMVRTERHKLVAVHGLDEGELYDLDADPTETSNRWDDPEYQSVKVELLKRLCDRMARTNDPLPPRRGIF